MNYLEEDDLPSWHSPQAMMSEYIQQGDDNSENDAFSLQCSSVVQPQLQHHQQNALQQQSYNSLTQYQNQNAPQRAVFQSQIMVSGSNVANQQGNVYQMQYQIATPTQIPTNQEHYQNFAASSSSYQSSIDGQSQQYNYGINTAQQTLSCTPQSSPSSQQLVGTQQQQRPFASVRPMMQAVQNTRLNSPQPISKPTGQMPFQQSSSQAYQPSANPKPEGVILSVPDDIQIKTEMLEDGFFDEQIEKNDSLNQAFLDQNYQNQMQTLGGNLTQTGQNFGTSSPFETVMQSQQMSVHDKQGGQVGQNYAQQHTQIGMKQGNQYMYSQNYVQQQPTSVNQNVGGQSHSVQNFDPGQIGQSQSVDQFQFQGQTLNQHQVQSVQQFGNQGQMNQVYPSQSLTTPTSVRQAPQGQQNFSQVQQNLSQVQQKLPQVQQNIPQVQQNFPPNQSQWQASTQPRAQRPKSPLKQAMYPRTPGQFQPTMPSPQSLEVQQQAFQPQTPQPRAAVRQTRPRGKGRGRGQPRTPKSQTPRFQAPNSGGTQNPSQTTRAQAPNSGGPQTQVANPQSPYAQQPINQQSQVVMPQQQQMRPQLQQQMRPQLQQQMRPQMQQQMRPQLQRQMRPQLQQQMRPQLQQQIRPQQQQQQVRPQQQQQQQQIRPQQQQQIRPQQQQQQQIRPQQQQQIRPQQQQQQQVRPQQQQIRPQQRMIGPSGTGVINAQMASPAMASQMSRGGMRAPNAATNAQQRPQTGQMYSQFSPTVANQRPMTPRAMAGQPRQARPRGRGGQQAQMRAPLAQQNIRNQGVTQQTYSGQQMTANSVGQQAIRGVQPQQTFAPIGSQSNPRMMQKGIYQGQQNQTLSQQPPFTVRPVQPNQQLTTSVVRVQQTNMSSDSVSETEDDFAHLIRTTPVKNQLGEATASAEGSGDPFQSVFLSFIQGNKQQSLRAMAKPISHYVKPTTMAQVRPTTGQNQLQVNAVVSSTQGHATGRLPVRFNGPPLQQNISLAKTQAKQTQKVQPMHGAVAGPSKTQPTKPVKKAVKPRTSKTPKRSDLPIGQQIVQYEEDQFIDPLVAILPQRATSARKAKETIVMTAAFKRKLYAESDSSGEERDYDSDKDPGWMPFKEQFAVSDSDGEQNSKKKGKEVKQPQKKKRNTGRRAKSEKIEFTYDDTFGETHLCQLGDFIVQKKCLRDENFCIWKLDSGSLIQKFEPVDCDEQLCHQATTTYSKWTLENKEEYQGLQVNVLQEDDEGVTLVQMVPGEEEEEEEEGEEEPEPEPEHTDPEADLESDFFILMQTLISQALEPGFIQTIIDEEVTYYLASLDKIDQLIMDKKAALLDVMEWSPDFLESVERRPYMNMSDKTGSEHCQARVDLQETVTKSVELYGQIYDSISLENVNGQGVPESDEFVIGPGTAKILPKYHKLEHFKFSTYKRCIAKVGLIKEGDESQTTKDVLDKCLSNRNWVLKMLEEFKKM